MAKPQHVTATVFDKRGRVLGTGANSYRKTHPKQFFHSERVNHSGRYFLHAEILAIIRASKTRKKMHRIKVERYHKDGSPANACPCEICMDAIRDAGIKHVEFTMD